MCDKGVKQGDNLSPTLFSVFVNDLVAEINNLDLGVKIDESSVSMLLYADDIALIANSEADLQIMLNQMHDWCKRWRVLINTEKSKVVHFRKGRSQRTDTEFKIGLNVLEIVDKYKYLGVVMHEKRDYSFHCEMLAKSAGRALGSIINKIHNMKQAGFKTYEKLYNSCVIPISDYCASIWGFKHFKSAENVHHRAIRYFLGVHRFTPILALLGEIGWLPSIYRRWLAMIRFWNRLVKLDEYRLTKRAFERDYSSSNNNNWCSEFKTVMSSLNLTDYYNRKRPIPIDLAKESMTQFYSIIWSRDYERVSKLRTYRTFKTEFVCEEYLTLNLKRNERALFAQFRTGILPLRVETGRYVGEAPEQRRCKLCHSGLVEDETHFLVECALYENTRSVIFGNILNSEEYATCQSNKDKLVLLVKCHPRKCAKFVVNAFYIRSSILYK
ncbi:hypothetical protein DPMN_141714 [Dreissena polymorpha]|uniref:Reverse transcriptase domain-containing protein n=1 Tax=Dreissena polymorpha TaxID=45954 RepID=A0A9D4JHZ1_DREPO|nr:hypothetical protein DPMN_141714 [Dreissena polymorpha]